MRYHLSNTLPLSRLNKVHASMTLRSLFHRLSKVGKSARPLVAWLVDILREPFSLVQKPKALKIFTAYHSSHSLNERKGIIFPFHAQYVKIDSLPYDVRSKRSDVRCVLKRAEPLLLNLSASALLMRDQRVIHPMVGASSCAEDLSAPSRLRLRVRPEAAIKKF